LIFFDILNVRISWKNTHTHTLSLERGDIRYRYQRNAKTIMAVEDFTKAIELLEAKKKNIIAIELERSRGIKSHSHGHNSSGHHDNNHHSMGDLHRTQHNENTNAQLFTSKSAGKSYPLKEDCRQK
jgi:hypothetical protein